MQSVLDLVWDKLLPAMKASPLPPDDAAHKQLQQVLQGLSLRLPVSTVSSRTVPEKAYLFPANDRKLEAIKLVSEGRDGSGLILRVNGEEQRLICGQAWQKGHAAWDSFPRRPVASSGAWTTEDTFTVKLCFFETPFITTFRLKFTDDELRFSGESNVGFGSTREPELIGKPE